MYYIVAFSDASSQETAQAHPQLTLRTKSPGVTIPDTTRCSRFTTLTCLICDLAVYRVHQLISAEVEAKDLPLLPSDDWAEQEIMKSPNGSIEIHKDCLVSLYLGYPTCLKEFAQYSTSAFSLRVGGLFNHQDAMN